MQDSAKYLIHADIRASGVVERSDVVGAIFGQTEGLLGEDLDLRDLQEASKVGRIDVEIDSEAGRSFGSVTIASGLDRVETAVLAAALETIDRIGPCRAEFRIRELEDARAAKRREVVERATELLASFEETALTSRELIEEVRQNVRVADITEFEGLPAGPRVAESDAVVVVEGRADVLQLLQYGIKNAVAVEGTNVPDAVAELTSERTVTAFLDGDRGGDLILKELTQVGNVDYVAFAPAGRSVEDLSREEVLSALRKKAPVEQVTDEHPAEDAVADEPPDGTGRVDADGGTAVADSATTAADRSGRDADAPPAPGDDPDCAAPADTAGPGSSNGDPEDAGGSPDTETNSDATTEAVADPETDSDVEVEAHTDATADPDAESGTGTPPDASGGDDRLQTLAGHVGAVVGEGTGRVRLLDEAREVIGESDATDAFDAIEGAEAVPDAVVLDGELSQRVLDVAAQRGVVQIVAAAEGEFVKQPAGVRVRTASEF
jgi:5S rRNA maturation endonuclease (ribonuclease M5)